MNIVLDANVVVAAFAFRGEKMGSPTHWTKLAREADEYAKELSRYMDLSPVRAGMVKAPEGYEWSSCRYYTVQRKAPVRLQRDFILSYFDKELTVPMKMYCSFVHTLIA